MKKWMYVIFPTAMLGAFLALYIPHLNEVEAKEKERLATAERLRKEDEARKDAIAERSREDARKHAAEAAAKDALDAAAKQAKYDADMARVVADTAKYNAEADAAAKKVSALEIELDSLHKEKDFETRRSFDIDKQLELANVQRRSAELEIARTIQMIANRAADSSLEHPVTVAVPPSIN